MKRIWTSIVIGTAIAGLTVSAALAHGHDGAAHKAVEAALAAPARAVDKADDARRKASEVVAFSGVKPGDRVVDFIPGAGYWTRIFSGVVGTSGKVYALWPMGGEKYAEKVLPGLKAIPNVVAEVDDTPLPSLPEPIDLFWTVQNYHDIANYGGEPALKAYNAAVLKSLKPGGIYIVIDHADATGSGLTGTNTTHRIEPGVVKAQVIAAGFEFVGALDVLANPADDHKATVFDPKIKGHTDQFVFKFRKPG